MWVWKIPLACAVGWTAGAATLLLAHALNADHLVASVVGSVACFGMTYLFLSWPWQRP